jgi:short-subunit dehydrogenase
LSHEDLYARYGGYALVTGAARGIGRAFATELAAQGFKLLLIDKLAEENQALARRLSVEHQVEAEAITLDLLDEHLAARAEQWCRAYDIGVLVNNAGISAMGRFLEIPLQEHLKTLELNCRATLTLSHSIGNAMVRRGRGAIVIVSSESSLTGAPYFAHYAATKGYGLNLSCGLWEELRHQRIDVLGVCPGLTNTAPIHELGLDATSSKLVPLHEPERVVSGALRALGKDPVVVPTPVDRISATILSKLLPRKWTLSLMARSMQRIAPGLRRD